MQEILTRDPSGLELKSDAAGLAPERLLVLEVRGAIARFAEAVRKIPGLELVDEEELAADELDRAPALYLLFPDVRALRELCSLWQRWGRGERLGRGFKPWEDVFALLRALRPWGPKDRLSEAERARISEQIEGRGEDDRIRLEIELVFRPAPEASKAREEIGELVRRTDGRVVAKARIEEVAYDALLVELPARAVRDLLQHEKVRDTIAWADPVMHIRPQATVDVVEPEPEGQETVAPEVTEPVPEPVLVLLDGVPVAAHPLLQRHLIVDDLFGLEPRVPVDERKHGTAMASLLVWGDLNRGEPPLPHRIVHLPILESDDRAPNDRLIVDLVYRAVRHIASEPTLRDVLIVNLSIGNQNLVFQGHLSPWARLLDRLAWEHGLLFVVSAGNHEGPFEIDGCATWTELENKENRERAATVLRSVDAAKAHRRLLSPSESINALTVGAWNHDDVPAHERTGSANRLDPYPGIRMVNPSSALGPGFARSVKPDVVMPGGREHLLPRASNPVARAKPAAAARQAGLKVAAPPDGEGWTGATSAAAAQASRLAHRVHDVLERAYGAAFLGLPKKRRAILLKAFVVHAASWPDHGAALIQDTVGSNGEHHAHRKANVFRYFGYGCVDPERALACAEDRATFWAVGEIAREAAVPI
ncbi:MAG: S8 family peptidase, partial [Geminicoccaceae bacterium]|nr:S8 family peptidase [Geminicoccaceae bacterium]